MEFVTVENGVEKRIPLEAPYWSPRSPRELAEQFTLADRLSENPPPRDEATALLAFAVAVRETIRWVLTGHDSPMFHLDVAATSTQARCEALDAVVRLQTARHPAEREVLRGVVESVEWVAGERATLVYPPG